MAVRQRLEPSAAHTAWAPRPDFPCRLTLPGLICAGQMSIKIFASAKINELCLTTSSLRHEIMPSHGIN